MQIRFRSTLVLDFGHLNLTFVSACPGATFRLHTDANRSTDSCSQQVVNLRQVWARDFVLRISDFQLLRTLRRSDTFRF
jgi:hypothetical protein